MGQGDHRMLDATLTIGGLQPRLFNLLEAIEETGSLVAASKQAGLSYKGAWDMIERTSLLSPRPLIERNPGGGHDRGTRLTETGSGLLAIYRKLQARKEEVVAALYEEFADDPILLQWYRGLILRSSTRNQWMGEVLNIKEGAVNALVTVRLNSGREVRARVSRSFVKELGLVHGTPVIAIVKAPMVHLLREIEGYVLSAENTFEGRIKIMHRDAVAAEIIVALPSGESVVATLSVQGVDDLAVQTGESVWVSFDADDVILAAPQI
jgi:molybdate transport system regulatory protein